MYQSGSDSIPLITYSIQEGYRLHSQAIQFINSLPKGKNCHVLAVVGKVKTGKSYLLNKLMQNYLVDFNSKQYSEVSNHLAGCTKGIRIMTKWVEIDQGILLFLDTEGLGSLSNSIEYDCKLFAMTLLLSSTIIYNNVGAIDEQSLQNLSLVIQIGKLFEKYLLDDKQVLGLPTLFMALRDFSLKLENKLGKQITPNNYLQECLEEQKGLSQTMTHKNRIRRIIRQLFSERNCDTLVLPSQQLPITYQSQTRQQFCQDIQRLSQKVMQQIKYKPKVLNNQIMDSERYILCLGQIVQTFNNSSIPKIENLFLQIHKAQINQIKSQFKQSLIQVYKLSPHLNQDLSIRNLQNQPFIDEKDVLEIQQKILVMKKILDKIQIMYEGACQKLRVAILGEKPQEYPSFCINYNSINISEIKQFKDIWEIKITKENELKSKIEELNCYIAKEKTNLREKMEQKRREQKIINLIEDICLVSNEKQLEQKFLSAITRMKSNTSIQNLVFQNHILKVQVAYLKRKLQLKNRSQSKICIICLNNTDKSLNIGHCSKQNNQGEQKTQKKLSHTKSLKKQILEQHCSNIDQTTWNKKYTKEQPKFCLDAKDNRAYYIPYLIIQDSSSLEVQIIRTLVKEDNKRNNYIQYILEVKLLNKKWTLNRKWKDFCQLNNILQLIFPTIKLPICESSLVNSKSSIYNQCTLKNKITEQFFNLIKKDEIEERRSQLERYIRNLIHIEDIRNSRILQKFIKINKEFIITL